MQQAVRANAVCAPVWVELNWKKAGLISEADFFQLVEAEHVFFLLRSKVERKIKMRGEDNADLIVMACREKSRIAQAFNLMQQPGSP